MNESRKDINECDDRFYPLWELHIKSTSEHKILNLQVSLSLFFVVWQPMSFDFNANGTIT